jgi:hypothetical protein
MSAARDAWEALTREVTTLPGRGRFEPVPSSAPEAVRRYFGAAIAPGTALAPAAELEMRGSIRLGRWLPFRARQLLAPALGTVWIARVGGVLSGFDSYVDALGRMDWRVLGAIPIVRAAGPDVTRSAAGRVAGESVWVPTAVAPGLADWEADGDGLVGQVGPAGAPSRLHHELDPSGLLRRSSFERWGDPDRTGTFALHRFEVEVAANGTFDDVTIPVAGEVGWDGRPFFRFEISAYRLVS